MSDPLHRFSSRATDYNKYRPDYPPAAIEFILKQSRLNQNDSVADVGSGTGILTKHFVNRGIQTYAIEPNDDMRRFAEISLSANPNFHSIKGTSDNTKLEDQSINAITVAQAFHWFEVIKTKNEFKRILKDGSTVYLLWNSRRHDKPILMDYENLTLKFSTEYSHINHLRPEVEENIVKLFEPNEVTYLEFPNDQELTFDELLGRIRSSSYMLNSSDKRYPEMVEAYKAFFEKYQKDGKITIPHITDVYYGQIG